MGTVVSGKIAKDVAATLNDDKMTRWTLAEITGYMNDAQRLIVELSPRANTVTELVFLKQGMRQDLPGLQLINVIENMTGEPVELMTDFSKFSRLNPDKDIRPPDAVVERLYYSTETPRQFLVYPDQPAVPGAILATYSVHPNRITDEDQPIRIGDEYERSIYHYCLFRCYMKNSADSQFESQRSAYNLNSFYQLIDRKDLVAQFYDPKKPEV